MFSDSRKAQHNSFAHHRANLLFSSHVAKVRGGAPWAATTHEGTEPDPAPVAPRPRLTGTLSLRPAKVAAATVAAATAALLLQPALPA